MIDKKYEKRYTMYIEIKRINVKKYHVNPRSGNNAPPKFSCHMARNGDALIAAIRLICSQ